MTSAPVPGTVALLSLMLALQAAHAECTLQFKTPVNSKIETGLVTVSFGEADDQFQPSAWQGPITAGTCTFDDGILEEPIAVAPAHRLFVSSYSGSTRQIALSDLRNCSVVWKSEEFEGSLTLTAKSLHMGDRMLPLDEQCVPVEKPNKKRG